MATGGRFFATVSLASSVAAGVLSCRSGADPGAIVVATVTRCGSPLPPSAPLELALEGRRAAFFSEHPLSQIQFHGGRTLKSPRVIGVFFPGDPMQYATEVLLESYGCTSYWRDAVNEYGVGDAVYARTVSLPAVPDAVMNADLTGFETWLADGVTANVFGDVGEEDVLLFFLPPEKRLLTEDCSVRLGGHSSVVTKTNQRIPYAYFDMCGPFTGPADLAMRTHITTHELIEIATDPEPDTGPAWKTLGAGVTSPGLRPSTTSADDEGADYCNSEPAPAPDYPFEIAQNYSNRRARGGRNPCDSASPLLPIAALHHDARGQAASVDLSSGSARIVLDIFAEDASVALTLSASATFSHDNVSVSLPLFDGATLTTRDGDSLTVDLALRSPGLLESDVAKATRREVVITLCPSGGDGGACGDSRIPISALPPTVADAGAEDAGIADAPPPGPG